MSGTPVAIVGASGFTGCELAWIIAHHPRFELVAAFGSTSSESSRTLGEMDGRLRGVMDLPIMPGGADAVSSCGAEVVFLATPHEASAELASALLDAGKTVIDLSGAFRLRDEIVHREHYGFERDAGLVASAAYGLPERTRGALGGASLVACAGCYVTAASVPLGALADAGAIPPGTRPIIDAVSGVSGAGRAAAMHLAEVSAKPYGVGSHRHAPEIEMNVGRGVIFQPHLGAFDRGILATIHVELGSGWDAAAVEGAMRAAFGGEPFVRVMPEGVWPSVAGVRGTNFVDLAWSVDRNGHAVLFAAIDNLVKGASGQAVQCANVALGLDETLGLIPGCVNEGVPA
ncbi:MAG: N-acetyl-gamma-glutamyl-phosphate reductase [Phycisphaerales bacterium]